MREPRQSSHRDGQPRLEGKTLSVPRVSLAHIEQNCDDGHSTCMQHHHRRFGPGTLPGHCVERTSLVPRSRCMAALIPQLGVIKPTQAATTSSRLTSPRKAQVATCHHPMGTPLPTQTTATRPAAAGYLSRTTTCQRSCQLRFPASHPQWLLGTQSCISRVSPGPCGPLQIQIQGCQCCTRLANGH